MRDLVRLFEAGGAEEVRTYVQSGNVVFRAGVKAAKGMAARIRGAIADEYDYDVPVLLRTAQAWSRVVESNPFLEQGCELAHLHVAFLEDKPTRAGAAALDPERSPGDEFRVLGKEVFLHLPNGVARSKLTGTYLEGKLGTTVTARNWRTVTRLQGLAQA